MSFAELRKLLLSRARKRRLDLEVKLRPWPEPGMVSRVGDRLVVNIDNRQSQGDQTYALAHEAGHVLFGHYLLDGEVWTMVDGVGADEWEWEAHFFAEFATRTPGTPAEWFIGGQLRLL